MLRPALCCALPLIAFVVASCSSVADDADAMLNPSGGAADGGPGTDGDSVANTGTAASAGSPSAGSPSVGNLTLTSGSSSAGGGGGTPEVCDGIDNDGNGIADDVDAG